ncbi:MAG: hypothetical protein V3S69_07995 [Dehalococcoidales bacterium]
MGKYKSRLDQILTKGFEAGHMTFEEFMVILVCVCNTDPDTLVDSNIPTWENLIKDKDDGH